MSYHNQLIDVFCSNISLYEENLGFHPTCVRKNFPIGDGDIDILLENDEKRAVIEVKAHDGLLLKFRNKQLPKYRAYFPNAEVYSFTGNIGKSLDPQHLHFRKH